MAACESGDLLPKSLGLPGSLQREWKRCGRPACHCAGGRLHGPYWSRRWREEGRQRRAYVPRERVAEVRAAIALWKQVHPSPWVARRSLTELHMLEKEVRRCLL
jgi:hypothetical protein